MRASLFRWAAIAVVALGALLAGPNRALHAQAADDPLVALKARAQRWESLPPAERLLLCKEIAATGKPEAVDLLGTLALKSADEVSTLRWEINGTKQARYAAKADHKDAEANALTEKEAGLAKSFESAKTLEREFPALWAKLFAAPPTADGARFLARAANQFGQKVLLIDKERWETEWGSVARSKANQRYNTLNTARDAIVQGVARLESAEAVNVIVAEGLKKLTASDQMHARATLVEGLARLKRPESVNALVAVVKDAKELFPVKVAALIGLADLDARDHAADVAAALAEKEWPVVLQAAETLALLDARAQVGDVIKAMEKSDPGSRLREGLDECLSRYTGRRYYGDPKLWRKWWEGGKDAFIASGPLKPGGGDAALPPIGRAEPGAAPGAGAPAAKGPAESKERSTSTPTFYGIEIVSKKVIFCLDRSSSMSLPVSAEEKKFVITGGPDGRDYEKFDGTKLMLAKVQLKRAIRALPPDAEFNIVFFCHEVEVWKPRLSKATEAARQEAYKYIDEMAGIGTTNIMDPLDMAFRGDGAYAQGPDTVILLTDGLPNEGRIIDQNEIRAEVKRMNRARKIVIHTVGVGDHDRVFMRGLAEENGGKYKGY